MLEGDFAEPIQEYAQFAQTIKQVLKFRHMKHAQVELIERSLQSKKENLDVLTEMEGESRRLEEAIAREHTIGQNAVDIDELNNGTVDADGNVLSNSQPNTSYDNPYAADRISHPSSTASSTLNRNFTTSSKQRSRYTWSGPMQMVNAVGHTLQGLIDVDPVATRRNQIGKTKDAIVVVSVLTSVLFHCSNFVIFGTH